MMDTAIATASASPQPSPPTAYQQPVLLNLAHASTFQHLVDVGGIWNVTTKATDIVKDGKRIENIAWRHWADPRRKISSSSIRSESSFSIQTPPDPIPSLTFGNVVKLVSNNDGFKDWVAEAKEAKDDLISRPNSQGQRPPLIHVPSSPVAHLEIRLVEPTPVPSRVGSLGASMNPTPNGLLNSTNTAQIPPPLDEEEEQDTYQSDEDARPVGRLQQQQQSKGKGGKGKGKGKFFVQSSPSRASVSDSSPVTPASLQSTQAREPPSPREPVSPAKPPPPLSPQQVQQQALRRSSGSSAGGNKKKRHVSLSTMKGKFLAEKRKAAAALEAKEAREEDGGWEDDEEDLDEWSDDEAGNGSLTASPKIIPPPAPTPLVRMSKKQREAAKAEREQIEAELEAQRKREMFAKQQIFGQPKGLLSMALQRGGSLVDLQAAGTAPQGPSSSNQPQPRSSGTTHGFGQSPGPSLLRSKSAVAIPVQTGVSVTVSKPLARPTPSTSPLQQVTKPPTSGPSNSNGNGNGRARILPPSEEQLETTDEESEDDYLATETTKQKLEQLVKRKEEAKIAKSKSSVGSEHESIIKTPIQAIPVASSPTTDRRAMITRELSESLRKNLILERQKSSSSLSSHRHVQTHPEQPVTAQPRPNVLGRGFLRPLTRTENTTPVGELSRAKTSINLHRPQSSANLTISPGSPAQAPPMTRSNTLAGDGETDDWQERRAELMRRSLEYDTGYRSHGW